MRFVVDAQLPPALARRLETLGHTAEHVADRGMAAASDNAIRDYAASVGAAIVTKDEDFAIRRVLTEGPAVSFFSRAAGLAPHGGGRSPRSAPERPSRPNLFRLKVLNDVIAD